MKNGDDYTLAYHQSTAFGATAVGQVVALYDTILRDLRRATDATATGKIEERVNSSNHALLVIGELQSVLDFERGGEVARHLSDFYNVTRAMVANASITSCAEKFQELIAMFARIRAAWSHVEQTVAPSEPKDRPRGAPKPPKAFSQRKPAPKDSSEGSVPCRWTA
jgi:flagellar secretion chaperone FliS